MPVLLRYEVPPQPLPTLALRSSPSGIRWKKESTVTSYCGAVNYLLKTYVTDDVIAEMDAHMRQFNPPSNKSLAEYAEEL